MNKKSFKLIGLLSLIAATILLVACQSETKSKTSKSQEVQWGYTGITGPEHWGDLSKDYELSLKIINSARRVRNNLPLISPELRTLIFQN